MMTSIERFQASIARKPFDRIPFNIEMEAGLRKKFEPLRTRFPGITRIEDVFGCDRALEFPVYKGNAVHHYEDGTYTNPFGVRMRDVSFGKGFYSEAVDYPLKDAETLEEIEQYPWPTGADYDYSGLVPAMDALPEIPFTLGYLALGWFSWDMRGMEDFMTDLILEPELASGIIRKVYEYGYDYFTRLIDACRGNIGKNFCAIHLADDWATQNNLMISLKLYREFFKPYYRSLIDLAHKNGLLVEFHCCGSAVGLIPDLIDLGADILNPVQTSATGMDPKELKDQFGDHIAFSGGMDVQTVMPFGTPEEVRKEVYHLLDTIGRDGGYILQPSHLLQLDTPYENIAALVQAVYDYYDCPMSAMAAEGIDWCLHQKDGMR